MSISDLLASAGKTPSAFLKDIPVGTVFSGTIISSDVRQRHHYETGEPLTWDNGDPQQQVAIIIQTDIRNPQIEDDDGRRGIYIKWWGDDRQELLRAVKAAGDTDIRPGGKFAAKFVSEKPNSNPKLNATKIYQYWYEKPATGLDFSALGADQPVNTGTGEVNPAVAQQNLMTGLGATPVAQPPVQQVAPVEQAPMGWTPPVAEAAPPAQAAPVAAAPAAAAPQVDVDKIRQFLALGMTDEQIAAAAQADPAIVAAIRNAP